MKDHLAIDVSLPFLANCAQSRPPVPAAGARKNVVRDGYTMGIRLGVNPFQHSSCGLSINQEVPCWGSASPTDSNRSAKTSLHSGDIELRSKRLPSTAALPPRT